MALAATVLQADSQQRVASFGIGVELVSLSLAVTDGRGRPVADLAADDLAVFEDGVRQQVCAFAQQEWPIRLSILVDSSGSMTEALPVAQAAAIRMLGTLRAGDEAQVAQFNRHVTWLQEATGDREALERAVARISPQGETALYNALYITLKDLMQNRRDDELARRAVVVLPTARTPPRWWTTTSALRFGSPDHPKMRHLIAGVVSGIGGYGNCVSVPTVGGEVNFDPAYDGNILVNAMTVGVAKTDKIFYSAATGIGNPIVYVGSKTGRDGIPGATMASADFEEDAEAKRPTVQVGDPFTEKLLIELPRADGDRRDRCDPGHGRGGPDQLLG